MEVVEVGIHGCGLEEVALRRGRPLALTLLDEPLPLLFFALSSVVDLLLDRHFLLILLLMLLLQILRLLL